MEQTHYDYYVDQGIGPMHLHMRKCNFLIESAAIMSLNNNDIESEIYWFEIASNNGIIFG